jgi:DNA recombination protein RmuC
MESWAVPLAFLGGVIIGLAIFWALRRSATARLQADLERAQGAVKVAAEELAQAHRAVESWRGQHHAEQLERARFETEARRVAGLEVELQQARSRLESLGAERSALQTDAERVPLLEARIEALTEEVGKLGAAHAQLQTQLEEQARAHAEKVAVLTQVRGEIEKDLKGITADALRANQGTFLQLANEVFEKHKTGAEAELEARQKAVESLVSPLRETLQSYKQQVDEMERVRSQSYGVLSTELKGVVEAQNAVRSETSKLVNALRAAPKTRGRWGEHTLRNVLELSGLSPYCDFSTEESFARDGSIARPDVVIRLPGERSIVVDAKTSLSAYLDAVDAIEDRERDRHLALHAAQIRAHVKQLAAKSYWDGLTVTPDFVVMFIPGDNFYAAAVERDPSLFEDAAAQRVIIVTPATLIALAKAVAFGWRQEKVAENAQRVHALGRELYRRILTMTAHIDRCGDALGKSVKHFNQFIGSLEHSVMPQARRFNELEVEGTATEVPELEHIEVEPRLLRSDRDFAEVEPASPPPSVANVA